MISFQEVTNSTGISSFAHSYGASWGDFNGDPDPDLWTSNHAARPDTFSRSLHLNQRDGTFLPSISQAVVPFPKLGDRHGAAWADFDNDGDQDLIQLVGAVRGTGSDPNQFYVNEGGILEERASELGIDYPLARGRTPLWFDFDRDGLLDLFLGSDERPDGQAPPTIFRQTNNGFEDVGSTLGFDLHLTDFGFLSDLSGDGNLDLVVKADPLTIYDITADTFEDITDTLVSNVIWARDITSGDFNGDLRPDLYLTRSTRFFTSDLAQEDSNSAKVRIAAEADQKGIQFNSSGEVHWYLDNGTIRSLDPPIYIGAGGLTFDRLNFALSPKGLNFTLSPDDPDVQGIVPHTPGVDRGIYIGYDSDSEQWQILLSSPERMNLNTLVESSEPINNLEAIGFDPNIMPHDDQLLINTDNGLIDQSQAAGINHLPIAGVSVASGDFDNDMDLDLYIVTTSSAGNRPNILYDNQGDGTFVAVLDTGGAAGTNLGVGDSVMTADYDLDGFLDLFVTNGDSTPNFSVGAPYELFRNQGNDNHWLEIDLEGVLSNRDAIGAQVFVTAGDVTQLREQSGGIHNKSQNHQRLHFGLADNNKVDEILIKWPNGQEQRINNVAADQLLHIIEPNESFAPGKPIYTIGSESGVFLWKDTFDGPYHLRTIGSQDSTQFSINLISTDGLLKVTPFSLEGKDNVQETEFGFTLDSRLFRKQDGVDFLMAPGAQALISITQDDVANPRQLNLGSQRTSYLSAQGWIINSEEFPLKPDFIRGQDLGLFVGQGNSSEELEFRWNGDGNLHQSKLSVLSSDDIASFSPVRLEPNDQITNLNNGVIIEGPISSGLDGLDVTTSEPVQIGFAYEQDGIFQPNLVNPALQDGLLEDPNAYWLPLATPYGQPEYEISEDSGLFLWKEQQGSWHLQVTAGADSTLRYVGSIVSDIPATSVEGISIERNDLVDTSDPMRIDFELEVFQGFQDRIDFSFPAEASVSLHLEGNSEEAASLLQVGSENWSVSQVPLDLSGWK